MKQLIKMDIDIYTYLSTYIYIYTYSSCFYSNININRYNKYYYDSNDKYM